MIKIVPHFMKVRNGESGRFVDYLVIKGAPGTIENLSYFSTNETGDSEELVMTQKGVTDIHDKLLSGETMVGSADYSNFAAFALEAESDADGNLFATTYAKNAHIDGEPLSTNNILEEAVSLIGDGTKSFIAHRFFTVEFDENGNANISGLPIDVSGYATFIVHHNIVTVWFWGCGGSPVYYNRYNGSSENGWTGWRRIVDSSFSNELCVARATQDAKGNVIDETYATKTALTNGTVVPKKATMADTATKADKATLVMISQEATYNDWLDVWFSVNNVKNTLGYYQRARQADNKFMYNPSTNTLRVGNITGNAATATKATTADKLSSKSFETATATFTIASGKGTSTETIMPGLYLTEFTQDGGGVYAGILLIRSSGYYTVTVGSCNFSVKIINGNKCTIEQMYYADGDRCYYNGVLTFHKISS